MAPPFLPVIKTITDSAGAIIGPVEELRIGDTLTATVVTGDGPDRIELGAAVSETVASVTGDGPIVITGTDTNPIVGISAASSISAGSMSTTDFNKLAAIGPRAKTPQIHWSAGATGIAKTALSPIYYELLWANTTGGLVTISSIVINGGRSGMALDGTNYTTITLVSRALDASGGDGPKGYFSNQAASLTAKADTAITISDPYVQDGLGVFIRIQITGTGADIGPGTRVYFEL